MTVSEITISSQHLDHLNQRLQYLSPQQIIEWAYITFPKLYQTTAFGLTGLVTIDMISKSKTVVEYDLAQDVVNNHPIDLIFIDTVYHFPQTYDLVDKVKQKYHLKLHKFTPPNVSNEQEFVAKYGDQLWDTNDEYYDFLVKVEPLQRAYKELGVIAVLTGRRKSQGGARGDLPVLEIEQSSGVIKINPLVNWNFNQVKQYIEENKVPYNELLDLGYKSIGDWHSTHPVADNEDERAGRWKGKAKTECGIHQTDKFTRLLQQTNAQT